MIQSVDRALRVLTALQGARRMSLAELAARLELPPSTVHGIVRTLRRRTAWWCRSAARAATSSGPAVLRLGNVYLDTLELRSQGDPVGRGPRPAHRAAPSAPACCCSTTS